MGSFLFFIITIIIQLCSFTMTAQEIRLANDDYFCLGENYKENSFFESKINLLLSGLSQIPIKLQIDKGYYYSTALGETTDRTYGSVQCRGLEMNKLCWNCVDKAVKDIKGKCPNKKEAIVWYDNCMVRYSDQSNFSIMKDSPTFYTTNDILIPINNPLGVILDGFINDLISEATSNGSPLSSKYATRAVNFTNSDKVYGLAQCTSDISSANCSKCLTGAFTRFKDIENSYEEQVARIIRPSCFLRYELYPFYDANTIAPPTNSTIIPNTASKRKKSVKLVVIIFVPSIIIVITIICFWYFCLRTTIAEDIFDGVDKIQSDGYSQPSFVTIRAATNNFSDDNKLGQGGFGSVYKGTLPDSQEIAVKRLSKNSCQGEEEFKNEAVLVVKLQHRNLVRLLGFCLDREERLLIYELMPNASLNHFIFDLPRCVFLSWKRRYRIIGGIARGLLYLHEDSRLKIIHRDLKASNVLLDADMNPKIADFGMARMFLANQTEANTSRIVGTFGYMAPEYAMHGHFSVKSDVFSFGVLVLEILSGRRNNSFYGSEGAQNLLSYAWRHWEEGTAMDLLDARLRENCSTVEVIRCIHIGLLCVQEDVSERPTMTSVINMLNNHSAILSIPSPPPTLFMQNSEEVNTNITQRESENATVNGLSMTEFYPR